MPEIVSCPQCQRRLRLPEDCQGKVIRCPACTTLFPAESASPASFSITATPPAAIPNPSPPLADRDAWESDGDQERGGPRSDLASGFDRRELASRVMKRRSWGLWIIVSVLIGAMLLAMGVGVFGILILLSQPRFSAPPVPVRVQEDDEERLRQVKQAFGEQKPLAPADINRELTPLFDDLGADLRAEDGDRILAHFDLERMVEEFAAVTPLPLRTAKSRRDFVSGMRRGMGASMAKQAPLLQWTTSEIRHTKKLHDSEMVVVVRHKHTSGASLKMRWWVTRREGAWKIYDYEDLNMGIRVSTNVATLVAQSVGKLPETALAVKTLAEAIQTVALQGNLDAAEQKLEQIERVKLPTQFEAMRFFAKGLIHLRRERPKEALEAPEEAHRLRPDMPIVDYWKGVALNNLERYDEALKHLLAYSDLLGEDADVCREVGEALRGLGRFPDAARSYRKALDLNPKDPDAFLGFLRSLGGDDAKEDVGPRFAKLDNLRENFDVCAADCEERQFPELLEPLVQTMRRIDPEYPPVDYFLSLMKARAGHADQAVPLFKSSLAKQPDADKRRNYRKGFLKAMASIGKFADAYAAVPDGREAFRILAAEAMERYRPDELSRLLKVHRKKHADDPMLPLYQAEVYVQEGRYALADRTFAAALVKPADEETLKRFRASRVLTRYHTGHVLSVYREIGPRRDTFLQLASLCFDDENDATLQALLEAHAKNEPDSADVLRFRCRLKIRQNQVSEGIALFRAALAKPQSDEARAATVSEFLADMVGAGRPLEGYRAVPDAEKAFQILAGELLEQDDLHNLRQLVELHRVKYAGNPWLAYYQGEIHLADKAWDKAAQAFGEGMKKAPKDFLDTLRARLVFSRYEAGQALRAYAETEPHDKIFTQLADLLAADKKGAELEALIQAHRMHAGNGPDLFYYESLAKVFAKKPAEAAPLFRKAYEKEPLEYRRKAYVSRFLLEMDECGQGLAGYRAVPDKSEAFGTLASQFVSRKKEKELAALLDEHGKGRREDPLYQFYLGELHMLRGEVGQAEQCFAASLIRLCHLSHFSVRVFRKHPPRVLKNQSFFSHRPGGLLPFS
jgi:predicted Zn-dependent protease